jgi:1L-myo-inositol 1-phosphate cytidylyltransferase / CDP-L-myo-inositol myo-inositolphosphotransferase
MGMASVIQERLGHSNTAVKTSPPLGILNGCSAGAWKKVGGIPLLARSLFHLNALGLKRVVLLWDPGHPPQSLEKWQGGIQIELRPVKNDLPAALLSLAELAERFIYVDAGHLIDARLLQALFVAAGTTLCHMDAADMEKPVIRAGLLSKEDLLTWSSQGIPALVRRAAPLLPGDIDPFRPEVRGPATPYFLEVCTDGDAREATQLLIRNQQKQVLDLPAQYIHPPFENALTFLLLKTPVSPNGVTIMVAALAFLVTWLFWHGYFVLGAFLAVVVNIMDGVDGKLARTKLQFSWLGKHEDVIDYFYENSWYIALGVSLGSLTGGALPLFCAAAMVLADTADGVFYTLAGKWHGKSIDLFSRFDRNFRRVAGRRNIYGALFILGFSLGYPLQTFVTATFWALVTAAIHGVRLHRHGQSLERLTVEEKGPS